MATVEIKARNGVRNDVSSERFSNGDLLTGRNIDIDETGKVFRRLGMNQLAAGAASSLWSSGEHGYYVRGGSLRRIAPDLTESVVATDVGSDVAFEAVNRVVFWTDGTKSGRVLDGTNQQWGIPVPDAAYTLSATFGDLPAGVYGVTVVRLRDGMESGARRGKYITLASNSGLTIEGLEAGYAKRVYVTRPDGEVFFAAADLAADETSCTLSGLWPDELPLRTQFMGPLPPGQVLGYYAGRMYVADGKFLYYSEPYEYELCDLTRNYIPFEANVMIFAPVNDGVYVATETTTFFLSGTDPDKFVSRVVSPVGGVRGTLTRPPVNLLLKGDIQGAAALWMSKMGAILGLDGGQCLQLTASRYIPPAGATKGGGLFKVRSGTPQYVASIFK